MASKWMPLHSTWVAEDSLSQASRSDAKGYVMATYEECWRLTYVTYVLADLT